MAACPPETCYIALIGNFWQTHELKTFEIHKLWKEMKLKRFFLWFRSKMVKMELVYMHFVPLMRLFYDLGIQFTWIELTDMKLCNMTLYSGPLLLARTYSKNYLSEEKMSGIIHRTLALSWDQVLCYMLFQWYLFHSSLEHFELVVYPREVNCEKLHSPMRLRLSNYAAV